MLIYSSKQESWKVVSKNFEVVSKHLGTFFKRTSPKDRKITSLIVQRSILFIPKPFQSCRSTTALNSGFFLHDPDLDTASSRTAKSYAYFAQSPRPTRALHMTSAPYSSDQGVRHMTSVALPVVKSTSVRPRHPEGSPGIRIYRVVPPPTRLAGLAPRYH